ncbi:MAG: DUF1579 domain-containing protein [Parachlamydia sp.]|nr:DUF1579 domain-containing protein [Parachlamydia sp.]
MLRRIALSTAGALLLFSCETGVETKSASQKETMHETPESTYEHLEDFNWLAGNWVDRERPFVTSNIFSWNTGKTMLIERFSIKIQDEKKLDGQQIIAWDPAKEQIRSWIFDSDGGFGEGVWTKEDDSWVANILFTMPDGRQASAVHIYKKIDDSTYTFTSENRDVDGNVLPNLGPFKFVRER